MNQTYIHTYKKRDTPAKRQTESDIPTYRYTYRHTGRYIGSKYREKSIRATGIHTDKRKRQRHIDSETCRHTGHTQG